MLSKINSVTIGGVGVGWVPPVSERAAVRALLVFLADRRALDPRYADRDEETLMYATESIIEIRKRVNEFLQQVPGKTRIAPSLIVMQHECVMYLDRMEAFAREHPVLSKRRRGLTWNRHTKLALKQVQRAFALEMAKLAVDYEIDDGLEDLPDILDLTSRRT